MQVEASATYTYRLSAIFSIEGRILTGIRGGASFDPRQTSDTFLRAMHRDRSHGSLIAGAHSIRSLGKVTIHLWGRNRAGDHLPDDDPRIPDEVWNSNEPPPTGATMEFPSRTTRSTRSADRGVRSSGSLIAHQSRLLYRYELDAGDATSAYFSHKVLALSYGGHPALRRQGCDLRQQEPSECDERSVRAAARCRSQV